MPRVEVDGVAINYDVQGDGEALLLIPYLSADHACYAFQLPAYTEHFSCIAIDLPGTGESDKPPGPYSTDAYAEQVAGFLGAIGVEQAHVAGVSLGAGVGMHLAARHPGRVRSLSLHSAWDASDVYLTRVVELWRTLAASTPTVADAVIQGIFPLAFTPELYVGSPETIDAIADFVRSRPAQPLDAFLAQTDAAIGHDAKAALGEIRAPTLITVRRARPRLLDALRRADPERDRRQRARGLRPPVARRAARGPRGLQPARRSTSCCASAPPDPRAWAFAARERPLGGARTTTDLWPAPTSDRTPGSARRPQGGGAVDKHSGGEHMRGTRFAAAIVALVAAASLGGMASVAAAAPKAALGTSTSRSDVREIAPGKQYSTSKLGNVRQSSARARALAAPAAPTPPVGTVRQWIASDDFQGSAVPQGLHPARRRQQDRGLGRQRPRLPGRRLPRADPELDDDHGRSGPAPDHRVRQQHVPEGDGDVQHASGPRRYQRPPWPGSNGHGGVYTGDGDKTVALIDNVRDDNFYTFPAAPTYIAGFFSSQFNELLDRNVMTVDAYDWAHRTGANPPDEPTADLCTSRPARPNLYEGTFAHEWQHLLHYYTDPFEGTWINEGISDYAQTLTGYVDSTATVFDRGADSHIYCFQGFGTVQTPFNPNPRDCGGPENSLNLWGEGNPNARPGRLRQRVLADAVPRRPLRQGHHHEAAQRRRAAGAAEPRGRAEGQAGREPVRGAPQLPVDGAPRQARRRRQALGRARRVQEGGDDAEPALVDQLRQPEHQRRSGRRAQRGGLRPAAGRQGQGAQGPRPALPDVHGGQAAAGAPADVDDRQQRPRPPGQPGAVLGQRQQHRRLGGHPGDRPDGRPDAALPRQVRRGVRLRLRLRVGVDRRRRHLHDDRRRQDRRRAARARPERNDRPASSRIRTTSRPTRQERPHRHPLRQ